MCFVRTVRGKAQSEDGVATSCEKQAVNFRALVFAVALTVLLAA
jgi:hypothetical protein